MFTVLRYFGYYWLIATVPMLVLFDWLLLERLPVGIEWLQLLLVAPGVLLVAVGFRRERHDADAVGHELPSTAPPLRFNDRFKTVSEPGKPSARNNNLATVANPMAQKTNLNMEQAADKLIESVVRNADLLRRAAFLLAGKDGDSADAISRILEASDAVRKLTADTSS